MTAGCRSPAIVLLLSGLLLGGCAGDRDDAERDRVRRGGTVVIAVPTDLDRANPLLAAEKFTQEVNRFLLFLPLLRYAPDLGYEPALAERWELIGDTAAVFHLRNDVRWHDGTPTRARDVVFTFEAARDPATAYPNAEYFAHWTGAEEVDSLTVRFRFAPHNEPLAGVPFLPVAPAHLLDSIAPERLKDAAFNRHPVGNGPFRFAEYRANDRWVFTANPDFPPALGRPNVDRIVWRIIPDGTARVTELRTGNVHVLLNPSSEHFAATDSVPGITGVVNAGRTYGLIGWNHRRPPLGDARVRRALGYAIDRAEIVRTLRDGHGELAVGPIAPFHWAFDSTLAPLPFAPDSAVALLREAGIADRDGDGRLELADGRPFRIELKFPTGNAINRDMAEMIDANLETIGIDVQLRALEFNTMVQDFTSANRDFDAFLLGWESDFRINLEGLFHSRAEAGPLQFAGYRNPEVDSLIDRTMQALPREQAKPLYARLQRIMREEQPWTFLYYYPDLALVSERVQDVHMDIRGALVNVSQWWVQGEVTAGPVSPGDSADRGPGPAPAPAR